MKRITKIGCILPLLIVSMGCLSFPEYFGVSEVKLPGGKSVYFKRHVWGRGDEKIVLSPHSRLDLFPDPKNDYEFTAMGLILYYKIGRNELLFVGQAGYLISSPDSGIFPIKVSFKELHPLDALEFRKKAKELGFIPVKIPIKGYDLDVRGSSAM